MIIDKPQFIQVILNAMKEQSHIVTQLQVYGKEIPHSIVWNNEAKLFLVGPFEENVEAPIVTDWFDSVLTIPVAMFQDNLEALCEEIYMLWHSHCHVAYSRDRYNELLTMYHNVNEVITQNKESILAVSPDGNFNLVYTDEGQVQEICLDGQQETVVRLKLDLNDPEFNIRQAVSQVSQALVIFLNQFVVHEDEEEFMECELTEEEPDSVEEVPELLIREGVHNVEDCDHLVDGVCKCYPNEKTIASFNTPESELNTYESVDELFGMVLDDGIEVENPTKAKNSAMSGLSLKAMESSESSIREAEKDSRESTGDWFDTAKNNP